MAAIDEISIRAGLAAVNSDLFLRVYETDVNGGIRETQHGGQGPWTGGTSANVVGTGKFGTPIAAASIGIVHIRVYYVNPDNTLGEAAYDEGSGWFNGGLSFKKFAVAPYSSVAACCLGYPDQLILRVYCQLQNNTIQEWCWNNDDKGWINGSNLGPALPGTQLAATSWGTAPNIHIRVYSQDSNLNIFEKCWDGQNWIAGGLNFNNPVTRGALGVTSYKTNASRFHVRVYYASPGNLIKEKTWDGDSWSDGSFSQASIPASNVTVVPFQGLRVYIQNGTKDTAVSEFMWNGFHWSPGQSALPPA